MPVMTGSEFVYLVLWLVCSFVGILLLTRKGYLNEPTNIDNSKLQALNLENTSLRTEYSLKRQDDDISIGYVVGLVMAFFAGPLALGLGVLLPRRRTPAN